MLTYWVYHWTEVANLARYPGIGSSPKVVRGVCSKAKNSNEPSHFELVIGLDPPVCVPLSAIPPSPNLQPIRTVPNNISFRCFYVGAPLSSRNTGRVNQARISRSRDENGWYPSHLRQGPAGGVGNVQLVSPVALKIMSVSEKSTVIDMKESDPRLLTTIRNFLKVLSSLSTLKKL